MGEKFHISSLIYIIFTIIIKIDIYTRGRRLGEMIDARYVYYVGKQSEISRPVIDEMHMERKRCFVDELGWGLETQNNLEIDQFDHSETEYVIVHEGGFHAASLRLHKNRISSSLMSAISQVRYDSDEETWELSRFVSSNFSFSTSEYLLIMAAFYRLCELNVPNVHATLNTSTARLFRMLGIEIHTENTFPCKLENCKNYVIKTDIAAFERFYRRVPNRDTAVLRSLSPSQVMKKIHTRIGKFPLISSRLNESSLLQNDLQSIS